MEIKTLQTIRFSLSCAEQRALVVVKSLEDTQGWVVEMSSSLPGSWEASVELPPGKYRARFYAGDDRGIVYYGAAFADDAAEFAFEGLDGVVRVEGQNARRTKPARSAFDSTRMSFAPQADQATRLRTLVAQSHSRLVGAGDVR